MMMMMMSSRAATTAAILVLVSLALLKNAVAQGAPSTPPTNPPFQIELVDVPVSAVPACKNRARRAFDIRVREIRSERNADIKEQKACEQLRIQQNQRDIDIETNCIALLKGECAFLVVSRDRAFQTLTLRSSFHLLLVAALAVPANLAGRGVRPVPTTPEQIERVKFEINRRKRTKAALKDRRGALKNFKALLMRDLKNAKNAAIDRARDEKKRVSHLPPRAPTPFPLRKSDSFLSCVRAFG